MYATYGAFDKNIARQLNHLKIMFHTHSLPMKWVHSGLTADLCAAYYAVEFAAKERREDARISPGEMSDIARFVVNELFENAVKFHSPGDISIASGIVHRDIIFLISNVSTRDRVVSFEGYLKKLMTEDVTSMLLERVEASALAGSTESGLGFLTLMSDYGVLLGWDLESVDKDTVQVKTMACLSM